MNEPFETSFLYEIEDDVWMTLTVTGTRAQMFPETKATMYDPGLPAEGGEIEIDNISGIGRDLTPEQQEDLKSDTRFLIAVESTL